MSDAPYSIKYRPHKLDDVIGQDVVVQSLTNAFNNKTLHHAYIFAGKFGCGKTSVARILAAMINCEQGRTMEPCGKCKNCKEIFEGKSLDVKEMDAASQRKIEDIRSLSKEIRCSPVDCATKVVILDEAHSLTGAAAEAALKMIEEPPPHVIFILATTDPHLLKDTIHSRCISLKFQKVNWNVLTKHLEKVSKSEDIEIEANAIKIAAQTAGGSVRNSLQNLQTLVNFAGDDEITADVAKRVLGAIDDSLFFEFVNCIAKTDSIKGIQVIEQIVAAGRNAEDIIDAFHMHLRSLMLARTCGNSMSEFGFSEEDAKRFTHQGNTLGIEVVLEMMSQLVDLNRALTFNLDPQVLLERYLIEMMIFKRKFDAKKKVKPT